MPSSLLACSPKVVRGWPYLIASHRSEARSDGAFIVHFTAKDGGTTDNVVRLDGEGRFTEVGLFQVQVGSDPSPIAFSGPPSSTGALIRHGELWAVRASIDGREGLWLVDTGAAMLVVDSALAPGRPRGTGVFPMTFSKSVTGRVAADWIEVSAFDLQGQVARSFRANTMDLSHLAAADGAGAPIRVAGLLGKRELAAFESRFDLRSGKMTLSRLRPDGDPIVARPPELSEIHDFELC